MTDQTTILNLINNKDQRNNSAIQNNNAFESHSIYNLSFT